MHAACNWIPSCVLTVTTITSAASQNCAKYTTCRCMGGDIPTIRTSTMTCARAANSNSTHLASCSASSRFPATSTITSRLSHLTLCSAATYYSAQAAAEILKGHRRNCTIPCNASHNSPTPPACIARTNTPPPTCASRWPANRTTSPYNNASPPPNNCAQRICPPCLPASHWKKPPTPSCAAAKRNLSAPCNSAAWPTPPNSAYSLLYARGRTIFNCGKRRSGIFSPPFGEVDERFKSHAWKACLG